MANFIALETSASRCSVAIYQDELCLYSATSFMEQSHSAMLATLVEKGLECSGISMVEVDAVAVGSGPGSYTGLRISTSLAKGICFGRKIPLIAVGTMENLAFQAFSRYPEAELALVAIDARREEIYGAVLNRDLEFIVHKQSMILGNSDLKRLTQQRHTQVVGSGAEKTSAYFHHPKNWHLDEALFPDAVTVGKLALKKWANRQLEVLHRFEPDYIKPVFITKPAL